MNLKEDRKFQLETALIVLSDLKIKYEKFSDHHFRVGDIDFWPTTGVFMNLKTGKKDRGIANFLKEVARSTKR